MMGRQTADQARLFYEFHLDERVAADHLLRRIDVFASAALGDLRQTLADHYSHTGRPSIDPELLIRMLIVGYCYGIRSERRLCEEVEDRLAFRWFCRLDIDDHVPDHSTFSKNRHGRFRNSDVLRHIFERVVLACITAGLVGGEGFAVDASLIEADANKGRSIPGAEWRKERDTTTASHAVKEYLATLDDSAFGAATEVTPKFVSPSDPASQWTGAMKSAAFFAYADNYLIDVKAGIIVDVEASRAIRQAEVGAARTMIERTEQRFGLKPKLLAADTAYGSAPMLNWLVEKKGIAPHIPVIDKSAREDGSFSRADFRYDEDDDVYICPAGKPLRTSGTIVNDEQRLYRGATADCRNCPLKPRCCPKEPVRKIPRSIYEAARDVARSLFGSQAYTQSRRDRKKVEMLFAHLKRTIPQDFKYEAGKPFADILAEQAIHQDRLQKWFAEIPARKSILMFDTCESGTLTGGPDGVQVALRGGLEQLAAVGRLIQATGRTTLTAAMDDQPAREGYKGHGVFTYALLDALARGDRSGNNLVEVTELLEHVDGLVPEITQKTWQVRQIPRSQFQGSNFALARQVAALAPSKDEIIISTTPTHVVSEIVDVQKAAGDTGTVVVKLQPFTTVTLVKTQGGWALVAKDGKALGFVAVAKLHALQ